MLHTLSLAVALTSFSYAPVPPPSAAKPKTAAVAKPASPLAGGWRMVWGSGSGDVVLTPDPDGKTGGYHCLWGGVQWIGSWKLEGDRLTVTEGRVPDDPDSVPDNPMTWTATLEPGRLAGKLDNGQPFALSRPEPLKAPKAE
jgi:hypothetical protein